MNRQQRRKANKSRPAYLRESPEEIKKRLVKNGITERDLKDNYDKGYMEGFTKSAEPVFRSTYAAVALALNNIYGFGRDRCYKVLKEIERLQIEYLTSTELIDDVYKRMRLELQFKDAFDRVRQID